MRLFRQVETVKKRRVTIVSAAVVLSMVAVACGSPAELTLDEPVNSVAEEQSQPTQQEPAIEDDSADDPEETATEAPPSSETVPLVPSAPIVRLSAEEASANAEANLGSLQSTAESAFDIEVLSVADGGVTTLSSVVDGDRAVMVWFWAPH